MVYRVRYQDSSGRRCTQYVTASSADAARDLAKERAPTGWSVFTAVDPVAECSALD